MSDLVQRLDERDSRRGRLLSAGEERTRRDRGAGQIARRRSAVLGPAGRMGQYLG